MDKDEDVCVEPADQRKYGFGEEITRDDSINVGNELLPGSIAADLAGGVPAVVKIVR